MMMIMMKKNNKNQFKTLPPKEADVFPQINLWSCNYCLRRHDFRRSLGLHREFEDSVRERSTGSFPKQRLVIEATVYIGSHKDYFSHCRH